MIIHTLELVLKSALGIEEHEIDETKECNMTIALIAFVVLLIIVYRLLMY